MRAAASALPWVRTERQSQEITRICHGCGSLGADRAACVRGCCARHICAIGPAARPCPTRCSPPPLHTPVSTSGSGRKGQAGARSAGRHRGGTVCAGAPVPSQRSISSCTGGAGIWGGGEGGCPTPQQRPLQHWGCCHCCSPQIQSWGWMKARSPSSPSALGWRWLAAPAPTARPMTTAEGSPPPADPRQSCWQWGPGSAHGEETLTPGICGSMGADASPPLPGPDLARHCPAPGAHCC